MYHIQLIFRVHLTFVTLENTSWAIKHVLVCLVFSGCAPNHSSSCEHYHWVGNWQKLKFWQQSWNFGILAAKNFQFNTHLKMAMRRFRSRILATSRWNAMINSTIVSPCSSFLEVQKAVAVLSTVKKWWFTILSNHSLYKLTLVLFGCCCKWVIN